MVYVFFLIFSDVIWEFVYKDWFATQNQGVITCNHKSNKPRKYWRQISLLNVIYKMVSLAISDSKQLTENSS